MTKNKRYVFAFEEGDSQNAVVLPQGFEYPDVCQLGRLLETAGVFLPGYVPPPVGLYSPDGFIYEKHVEDIETVLLPDLNVVADWVQLAAGGVAVETKRVSATILAFCQHLGIQLEPSIACHELAHGNSNDLALQKLAWVRAADNANFELWRDIALGRQNGLSAPLVPAIAGVKQIDLAKPLLRWNRNYICALKAAELELTALSAIERVKQMFAWMRHDFVVAGPAAIFACILFAPNSPPRRGLLKQLRSPDRRKAIAGVRNTAWDITHVSEFVRRVNETSNDGHRVIFASHDRGLLQVARTLMECSTDGFRPSIVARQLCNWWPEMQATRITQMLQELINCMDDPVRKTRQASSPSDIIQRFILAGEQKLELWKPTGK